MEALVSLLLIAGGIVIFLLLAEALLKAFGAGVRTMFAWATDRGAWGVLVMLVLWAGATPIAVIIAIYIGATRDRTTR